MAFDHDKANLFCMINGINPWRNLFSHRISCFRNESTGLADSAFDQPAARALEQPHGLVFVLFYVH